MVLSTSSEKQYIRDDYHNLISDSQRFRIRCGMAVPDRVVSVRDRNLAACATSEGDVLLIDDSINQFYKEIAKTKSGPDKRNGKKWSAKALKLTDKRDDKIRDYQHKASRKIVNFCPENKVSEVAIGNVAHSVHGISFGTATKQLAHFICHLPMQAHSLFIQTGKLFADNDPLPKKHEPDVRHILSGIRIRRGVCKSSDGTLLNADLNGAFNIIRKAVPEFNFKTLKDGTEGLFIPHCRLLTVHTCQ
ncbi:transposase [Desulfobacterales bacterium HSG2]|nr:transposase [Desulfobacterales bacterium HSG2]